MRGQSALLPDLLPTLPGCANGVVGRDPWRVQCQECGVVGQHPRSALLAIYDGHLEFHPWPDGSNPRLCRDCRLARGCDCHGCECERQGTDYPTRRAVR